jgi:hypothetical protein
MKALKVAMAVIGILLVGQSFAQSGAVIPQGGAGHAGQASCVILKRMGPADQVTSRLYSFGIRGKQFQYVEGKLPEGFPFHGRLTDHDVRNLQGRGAEVIVLNQNFTSDELKQARDDCRGETGKTPIQADPKPAPSPALTTPIANATPSAASAAAVTELEVTSTPPGADIEIDGKFVGSTPSSIDLPPGDHEVVVKKNQFMDWDRKVAVTGGHIHIDAELAPEPK